jgi:hypothetical protein
MARKQFERWLAEEASGHEDAADAAFAHLFAAVPKVEPNPAFVEQAVTAALRWRTRRRRLVAFAWAATILLVAAGVGIALFGAPRIATSVIKGFAFVSGRAVPWLLAYTTVAMSWWLTLGHVGSVIASALITPARAVALVGVELVGLLAFYALQRIAGAERFGDAQV